jgi:hypothetical protein
MVRDEAWLDPYAAGAWAKLVERVPQRTCNVAPPPSKPTEKLCEAVEKRFSCDAQPAKSICTGLANLTGSSCAAPGPNGSCFATCQQVCSVVEKTVQAPCK